MKALEGFQENGVYCENTVCSIVNLIINAIDTNKANQDFFLKNFKVEPLIKTLLSLTLRICGLTSLLISHLTWTSVDG